MNRVLGGVLLLLLVTLIERALARPRLPRASFQFTVLGRTVQFTDTSKARDGSLVRWNWDFGEGDCVEEWPYHDGGAA